MAISVVNFGLSLGVALLATPSLVFTTEVLAGYLPRRRTRVSELAPFRMTILVPAHDEAEGIEGAVQQLLTELTPRDQLLVIADNCSDETAALARRAGADVIERKDPERHGKGYALSFGAEHLRSAPPDALVVMDADCRIGRGSLRSLAEKALRSGRPTQAVTLLDRPAGQNDLSGISAFAFLVRNLLRPRGLSRLGLPCALTGTGMAFPWALFRDAPPTGAFLAEDRLLGHELALGGAPAQLDEDTHVVGELAASAPSSLKQRRRWEHGSLSLLLRITPRLLMQGVLRRSPGLFVQGLDSAVPPLALMAVLQLGLTLATGLIWWLVGPALPFVIAASSLAVLGLGVGVAWWTSGRQLLPPSELLRIPRYILWKLPLYGTFARRGAHMTWDRTDRAG